MAEELGVPTTTLSSLEQQESVPRGPMLQRLCDHFGVAVDYFFPAERKSITPAREWLRELRGRSFDGASTIATHSVAALDESTKEQIAKHLKAKLAQSKD